MYTTDTLVALNGVTFNTKNGAVGVGNYSNTKITGAPIKKSADELKGKAVALDYYDAGSNEEGAWVARDNDYPVLKSFAEN